MTIKLYDGKNCPCPTDCIRHGECKACIKFHKARNEQTYCENMHARVVGASDTPDKFYSGGKELRLLNYGPCAG